MNEVHLCDKIDVRAHLCSNNPASDKKKTIKSLISDIGGVEAPVGALSCLGVRRHCSENGVSLPPSCTNCASFVNDKGSSNNDGLNIAGSQLSEACWCRYYWCLNGEFAPRSESITTEEQLVSGRRI